MLNGRTTFEKLKESKTPSRPHEDMLDENMIQHLNYIVEQTDCKIVISSTWRRLFEPHEMANLLSVKGFKFPESVISSTPIFNWSGSFRGNEIYEWCYCKEDIESYCILDDDSDMLLWQKDNFVQTDTYTGLTPEKVEEVVRILNSEKQLSEKRF